MKKQVSIIIATYNSGKTIKRCLDSIVCQLGEKEELIIIDGNSTDNTMEIIRSYEEKIAYFISEKDLGVYDAWNKGIKVSKGEFITFIGSDDAMLPNTIEHYHEFFKNNGTDFDLVCGKLHFVDKNGKLLREVGEPWNWEKLIYRKWNVAHPGMLHNKRCFDRIGGFDIKFKICADSDFLQKLGKNIKTGFIDKYLVMMSAGGISDSVKAIKEGYESRKRNKVISNSSNLYGVAKLLIKYYSGKVLRKIRSIH